MEDFIMTHHVARWRGERMERGSGFDTNRGAGGDVELRGWQDNGKIMRCS